jgi:hypothetical protein
MVDSQKMASKASSGGQRIDDRSFWAGSRSKDSVFPDGPHKCKDESSAEGAGSLMKYEDTTEAIRATQVEGTKQAKSRPMKQPGYRN